MMNKFVIGVCNVVQLGCIIALAGIGLKRNQDCYEAEKELINVKVDLFKARVENEIKNVEIKHLKEELDKLKVEES